MANSERLTVCGIELEIVRRGSGRPILLLHGFQTDRSRRRAFSIFSAGTAK